MTEAAPDTEPTHYSWMTDAEGDELAECEKEWNEMAVEILDVKRADSAPPPSDGMPLVRLDVTVKARTKVGKRAVFRKFRILRAEEVWPSRDPDHKACSGRGYMIFTEKGPGRNATEFETPEGTKKIEYRMTCACASSRFKKQHPEIIMDGGYGFIPLEKGGERALAGRDEIIEEDARQEAVEEKKENGETRLRKQIDNLRSEVTALVTENKAYETEIAEAMAPYEGEQTRLATLLENDLRPRRAAAFERKKDAEAQAISAEAEAARLRAAAKRVASESDYEAGDLDSKIQEASRTLDRLPIPSRVGRLRRKSREALEKLAVLRERLGRKVAESKGPSEDTGRTEGATP